MKIIDVPDDIYTDEETEHSLRLSTGAYHMSLRAEIHRDELSIEITQVMIQGESDITVEIGSAATARRLAAALSSAPDRGARLLRGKRW